MQKNKKKASAQKSNIKLLSKSMSKNVKGGATGDDFLLSDFVYDIFV